MEKSSQHTGSGEQERRPGQLVLIAETSGLMHRKRCSVGSLDKKRKKIKKLGFYSLIV